METAEQYLERILVRVGVRSAGRYRTGVVAKVMGVSRERIRCRVHLPDWHPSRIRAVRDGAYHYIPHDELLRLVEQEAGFLARGS